jgi:hypothetical protein
METVRRSNSAANLLSPENEKVSTGDLWQELGNVLSADLPAHGLLRELADLRKNFGRIICKFVYSFEDILGSEAEINVPARIPRELQLRVLNEHFRVILCDSSRQIHNHRYILSTNPDSVPYRCTDGGINSNLVLQYQGKESLCISHLVISAGSDCTAPVKSG